MVVKLIKGSSIIDTYDITVEYPDSSYFNRVKQELASKGVLKESINQPLEDIALEFLKKH